MTRVLITGATGHIGSNTVRAAREVGLEVVGFARARSSRRAIDKLDIELREGDLLDPASVERAMDGVEIVLHVGAVHRNSNRNPDKTIRPAVDGTRNVLEAATRAGVRRVVVTSSGAAVGFARDPDAPLDETHFLAAAESAYTRAKIEQEKLALEWARTKSSPEIVVLEPSGVFGPFDYRLTPATRGFIGVLQGDPTFFAISVTDVRDVAAAHILAAERGRHGERYLVTGDVLKPKQLAALVDELAGIRPMTFRPPAFLLEWVVGRNEKKADEASVDPPASRAAIRDLAGGHLAYDSSKSRRELGMTYRPARDVLTDTLRWLLFVGALRPDVATKVRAKLGDRAAPDPDWG